MAATKNPLVRLHHIRDEINGVTLTLAGVDFDSYAASYSLKRTVERALQIISEAVKHCRTICSIVTPHRTGIASGAWAIFFAMNTIISILSSFG